MHFLFDNILAYLFNIPCRFMSRLVINVNLILLSMMLRNFVIIFEDMPSLRECCFTTMDMAFQSQLLMAKSGCSIRFFIFPLVIIQFSLCNNIFHMLKLCLLCLLLQQSYTEYMPLPISDLDSLLRTPSIYVFDCSAAGRIVNAFLEVFTNVITINSVFMVIIGHRDVEF